MEELTHSLSVHISEEMYDELEEKLGREHCSFSQLVRKLLERELEHDRYVRDLGEKCSEHFSRVDA